MSPGVGRWVVGARGLMVLTLAALLVGSPALRMGLAIDDHVHRLALTGAGRLHDFERKPSELFIFARGDPGERPRFVESGWLPWFTQENLTLSFHRPVSGWLHALDYRLWPDSTVAMHLHSILWYVLAVLLAALLYRRLLPPGPAFAAAVLFLLDDAHALPTSWIANRNALVALVFAAAAVLFHVRWRVAGWRAGAILSPLSLYLGLMGNEGALSAMGYLLAFALLVDRASPGARARSLIGPVTLVLLWMIPYKMGGFGARGSGLYIDPATTPGRYLEALVTRGPLMLLGQWSLPSELFAVLSAPARAVYTVLAVLANLYLLAVIVPLLRARPEARFFLAGSLLAVLPACATFPSDRLLVMASLGGSGLAALLIEQFTRLSVAREAAGWRLLALPAVLSLLFFRGVIGPFGVALHGAGWRNFGAVIERSARSFPAGNEVAGQRVIIVNTPTTMLTIYAPILQVLAGGQVPGSVWTLGSGIHPIRVERLDEHTLRVVPGGGYLAPPGTGAPGEPAPVVDPRYLLQTFDHLFRERAFTAGERLELGRSAPLLEVTVETVTPDGRPEAVRFRFPQPLEDRGYRWLQWNRGIYVPFEPPRAGESVVMPAAQVPGLP